MATPKIRWTKVNDGGLIPQPRHGHRAVAVRELMIIFGGGNEGIIDELHAYNTVTNQWFCPVVKGDVPKGAAAFGLAADQTRLLFFGGMIEYGRYTDALYELQVGPYFSTGSISSKWEWKKLRPKAPRFAPPPCRRLGHSFTFINGKYYVFGGLSCDSTSEEDPLNYQLSVRYLNDLYCLEFRSHSCHWEMPHTYGVAPSARESHTAAPHVDSLGNPKLLIYGGMAGFRLGDIYILDINSMTWSQPETDGPKPLPRSLHTSSVIGDKMYVFGGWVPVKDNSDIYEREWQCTNSLGRLNLNTYQWEDIEIDIPENVPDARAGHCAVVVGSRLYIWSGRDGYKRAWNSQVCCKDLWFLEVGKPDLGGKVQLVKAGTNMLEITWPEVPFCDQYVLQIMKYAVTPPPKPPVKRKRKVSDFDETPLPIVPPPPLHMSPVAETPLAALKEEILPSLLMSPPKPPPMTIPQPQIILQPPIIPQPPPPISPNNVAFFPLQDTFLPPTAVAKSPDTVTMRVKNPGIVLSKPCKEPIQVPRMMLSPATSNPPPFKSMQPRATVVKVVNAGLGGVSTVKLQQPPPPPTKFVSNEVFHSMQSNIPPKQHTIIINKPMNKLPSQQLMVVSSAPVQRPVQTIQTIARSDFNYPPPKQLKVNFGNGVKTLTIQGRTSMSAPSGIQMAVQNPAYKNIKLQVGSKTLTMAMPVSSSLTSPVGGSSKIVYQGKPTTILTNSNFQTRVAVRQEGMQVQQMKPVLMQSDQTSRIKMEPDDGKAILENKASPHLIVGARAHLAAEKSAAVKKEADDVVDSEEKSDSKELPDPPNNIKISKTADGAIISWSPPLKGAPVVSYCVNLGMLSSSPENPNKITFANVYSDVHTKTKIPQDCLDKATLRLPKPTIIFRVSARNALGFGPATQVRWLQDPKSEPTDDDHPPDTSSPSV